MIWRKLLGRERAALPVGITNLILIDPVDVGFVGPFKQALEAKLGASAIVTLADRPATSGADVLSIALADLAREIKKSGAQRLLVFGDCALPELELPTFRINARTCSQRAHERCLIADPALSPQLPDAILTGDPLAGVQNLPEVSIDPEICERFREQRQSGRWLGYFAATGEDEEPLAYRLFNRLIRHKMGLMLLAPFAAERCEPVYRDAIKYRLQTIRHNRLSTSFVPIKTRVYYIEEDVPRNALYACADWVVPGGTLSDASSVDVDLVTPILLERPLVVGYAAKPTPLLRAAQRAGVINQTEDEEQLFSQLKAIIDEPERAHAQALRAKAWLNAQAGALKRVIAAID